MYNNALQLVPMGVWKLPKNKQDMRQVICSSGEYFAQIKKDGYWYTYEKTLDNKDYLFGRKIIKSGYLAEKSANVPHLIKALHKALPRGTILATEVYYPGKTSNSVTSIMNCLPTKAITRQNGEYGLIHIYIHDIFMYNGKSLLDKDNWLRQVVLDKVVKKHKLDSISPYIEISKVYTDNLNKFIDDALDSGEEGVVLKKKDALFVPGGTKEAWNWIKFKMEDDCDVICIAFEPPTKEYEGKTPETWLLWENIKTGKITANRNYYGNPKYIPVTKNYTNGWPGAVRIGVYKDNQIIDIGEVGSGIPDEMFADISAHPEKYLNEPLLVRCMQPYENKLRHAIFIRWRDDINIQDCTFSKIFE